MILLAGTVVKPEPAKAPEGTAGQPAAGPQLVEHMVSIRWSVTKPQAGLRFEGGYACTDGQVLLWFASSGTRLTSVSL